MSTKSEQVFVDQDAQPDAATVAHRVHRDAAPPPRSFRALVDWMWGEAPVRVEELLSDEPPPMTVDDPLIGTTINGRYVVEAGIARGGMGRVYRGRQAPLGRPVALKIVRASEDRASWGAHRDVSQFLRRFLLEASILSTLHHPNIVSLYDYGRVEGPSDREQYFMAMELLEGETLGQRLRTSGAMPTAVALALVDQIARGLRDAHAQGILHRDLKPSNIFLVGDGINDVAKILDFGIGKVELGGDDLTVDGVLVGTPRYMAPEQYDGSASPASDVYALGILLFQCITDALPFPGTKLAETMLAKLQEPVPRLHSVFPQCDAGRDVERLIRQMLARTPEDRPSLDEVLARLVELRAHPGHSSLPSITPRPVALPDSFAPPSIGQPQRRGLWVSLGAAALVLATLVSVSSWASSPMRTANARSAIAPPPAAASAETSWVVLHLSTTPSGAVVIEDGNVLGATPLDVRIDRTTAPRSFQLKKDGYAAVRLSQGPAAADIAYSVALEPDPAAHPARAAHVAKPAAPSTSASAPTAPAFDTDLRPER